MTERSTLDDVRTSIGRRARWLRSAVVVVLVLVVGAAAAGLLGVHSSTASSTGDGYTAIVTYARVARAGWDVPFRIQVNGPEPLAGRTITIGVDRDYLSVFETQGLWPDPTDESGDPETVEWEFDAPPDQGDEFTVDYDAYIQPSAQIGADATVTVDIDDEQVAAVPISTLLFP